MFNPGVQDRSGEFILQGAQGLGQGIQQGLMALGQGWQRRQENQRRDERTAIEDSRYNMQDQRAQETHDLQIEFLKQQREDRAAEIDAAGKSADYLRKAEPTFADQMGDNEWKIQSPQAKAKIARDFVVEMDLKQKQETHQALMQQFQDQQKKQAQMAQFNQGAAYDIAGPAPSLDQAWQKMSQPDAGGLGKFNLQQMMEPGQAGRTFDQGAPQDLASKVMGRAAQSGLLTPQLAEQMQAKQDPIHLINAQAGLVNAQANAKNAAANAAKVDAASSGQLTAAQIQSNRTKLIAESNKLHGALGKLDPKQSADWNARAQTLQAIANNDAELQRLEGLSSAGKATTPAAAAASAPAATPSAIKTVTTRAERDALPKGAEYMGPDGKRYIKQ